MCCVCLTYCCSLDQWRSYRLFFLLKSFCSRAAGYAHCNTPSVTHSALLPLLLISPRRDVWRELIAREGSRGAAKGFSLNLIKGPIAFSVSLTTYDLLRAAWHTHDDGGGGSGGSGTGRSSKHLRRGQHAQPQ
jgi:hypothetical protein